MALFGRKKKEEVKDAPVKEGVAKTVTKKESKPNPVSENIDLSGVLIRPRITEKGAIVAHEVNAYTFDVDRRATKLQIKAAIEKIYKVIPRKVTIAQIPDKKVRVRGQRSKSGVRSGGKKAFVYLKKGDKIEFV